MEVLHSSAAAIQRQWRKYLIRKYKRQLEIKTKVGGAGGGNKSRQEFDQVSGRTSQCSELYNNKKYYANQNVNVYEESSMQKSRENSFNRNIFSFNLSEVKQTKIVLSPEKNEEKKINK